MYRDVENSILQQDEEIKAQYEELNKNTKTSYPEFCGDCTGKEQTNSLISSFKEFLEKDKKNCEKEEMELMSVLKKQKNHFDVMSWSRHVQGIASKRETRYQTNY